MNTHWGIRSMSYTAAYTDWSLLGRVKVALWFELEKQILAEKKNIFWE